MDTLVASIFKEDRGNSGEWTYWWKRSRPITLGPVKQVAGKFHQLLPLKPAIQLPNKSWHFPMGFQGCMFLFFFVPPKNTGFVKFGIRITNSELFFCRTDFLKHEEYYTPEN